MSRTVFVLSIAGLIALGTVVHVGPRLLAQSPEAGEHAGHEEHRGHDTHRGHEGHEDHAHADHAGHTGHDHGATKPGDGSATRIPIDVPVDRLQLIGVRFGTVEKREVSKAIRAVGRIDWNERNLSAVSLKFSGWIEKLLVNATGDSVTKGQTLLEIYSPELYEAERSHVIALESRPRSPEGGVVMDPTLRSTRDRLLLWDLSEEQVSELEKTRLAATRVPVLSKVQGVVTKRNVVLGASVAAGTTLFEIADLSTVWVQADLYEYELPDVKVGLRAEVTHESIPGDKLEGKVIYVYPYMNEQTRTASVRLEVPNREGQLRPGMYCNVKLFVDLGEQLVVDEEAVLDSGERQIVFVDEGAGRLAPREIVAAPRVDGKLVVKTGLSEGERIVTSGNFLIDSESRLKAALAAGQHAGHQH